MDNFFRYFYQDIGRVFQSLAEAISAILNFLNYLFNFPMRMKLIESYGAEFTFWEWMALAAVNLALAVLAVLMVILLGRLLRKLFRRYVPAKKYDEAAKQIRSLQRDLIRANYEKDKLMNLQMPRMEKPAEVPDTKPADHCVEPRESRFFRLTMVDNFYKTSYTPPVYENEITLESFCVRFRQYAASQLGLYYDLDMIRYFVAAMGTARIIILQGISGTGKTSLPYAFGKFVSNPSTVVSVQPAWRERTELYGYFNEFSKKYSETDFLRAIYEANYYRDPHVVILDEMNIARVEYYFAEMLSILEMPRQEERVMDIVSSTWENDPCLIQNGKVQIPDNVWFVGTINNDDSTFAVADKVYDRAIPIDLDSRIEAFETEAGAPIHVSTDRLNQLFAQAKDAYPISQQALKNLESLNAYLIEHFRLAFGNRIMKQIREFVPCFMGCGGTELQAIDFIVAKKVLRKMESLNLGFMKEDLTRLNGYLDQVFGKNKMSVCKEYVELLKRNN